MTPSFCGASFTPPIVPSFPPPLVPSFHPCPLYFTPYRALFPPHIEHLFRFYTGQSSHPQLDRHYIPNWTIFPSLIRLSFFYLLLNHLSISVRSHLYPFNHFLTTFLSLSMAAFFSPDIESFTHLITQAFHCIWTFLALSTVFLKLFFQSWVIGVQYWKPHFLDTRKNVLFNFFLSYPYLY